MAFVTSLLALLSTTEALLAHGGFGVDIEAASYVLFVFMVFAAGLVVMTWAGSRTNS